MATEKRKPCPFCGGETGVYGIGDKLQITCVNKKCGVSPSVEMHRN